MKQRLGCVGDGQLWLRRVWGCGAQGREQFGQDRRLDVAACHVLGAGEDLGGQIGGMLAEPRSSPGVDLRDVTVVELREGFSVACPEKLGV